MDTQQIAHEPAQIMNEAAEQDRPTQETAETPVMTRYQRYYQLHREQRIARHKDRYKNNPEVIAKREERERKKAEKEEAERLAKEERKRLREEERAQKREEKLQLALATRKARPSQLPGVGV